MKLIKLVTYLALASITIGACKKDKNNNGTDLPEPAAYYPLDGDATDKSLYKNPGWLKDVIGTTADSFGTSNAALYFSKAGYVEIKDDDIFDFVDGKFSISAWIRPVTTFQSYVVQKSADSGGGGPYSLDIFPGTARALVHTQDGDAVILQGSTTIKKNVWQHIAMTCDGKNVKLYYNGVQEDQALIDSPIEVSTGTLNIGAYKYAYPGNTCFEGSIDNVRLYSTALSAEQVNSIYMHYK